MAEITDTPLQQGIAALREILGNGDASGMLQSASVRAGEAAAFCFPLPIDYEGEERKLYIGFPNNFPSEPLRLHVEPSPWLLWPHAMESGLCLHGFKERPVTGSPASIVRDSLSRLTSILSLSLMGSDAERRKTEFQNEITSYWIRQHGKSLQDLILLGRPREASELFAVSDPRYLIPSGQETVWLSSDVEAIKKHFRRMTGRTVTVRSPMAAGFYIKLASYPDIKFPTPKGLIAWLLPHISEDDAQKVSDWFDKSSSMVARWIILELPGHNGAPVYTLNLYARRHNTDRGPKLGLRASRRRPVRASGELPECIRSSGLNVLDRADIHSRDLSNEIKGLETAHVVFVGVGSLGGAVASQLVRAGLKQLTLIDPDNLESANLGRHILGADDLGKPKAQALQYRLIRDLPTIDVVAFNTYAQFIMELKPEIFEKADLIIVTTADWESEAALWTKKAEGAIWGLLQGWSEPHTLVGHALIAPQGTHDGRYLFSDKGDFIHRYTNWPRGGVIPLPACGESFIPGGSAGMTNVAAMVAQAAIRFLNGHQHSPTWVTSLYRPQDAVLSGGQYLGPELPEGTIQSVLERGWPESEKINI